MQESTGRHRQSNQPLQCGYCSSCLLRRLAFFTANVEDKTEYVVTHGTKLMRSHHRRHFKAMDHQAKKLKLLLDSQNEWQKISSRYPELREIVYRLGEQVGENIHLPQNKLIHLYRRHITEGENFRESINQNELTFTKQNMQPSLV